MSRKPSPATAAITAHLNENGWSNWNVTERKSVEHLTTNHADWCIEAAGGRKGRETKAAAAARGAHLEVVKARKRLISRGILEENATGGRVRYVTSVNSDNAPVDEPPATPADKPIINATVTVLEESGSADDNDEADDTDEEENKRYIPDLVINGVPEKEIWSYAPVMKVDRVHWNVIDQVDENLIIKDLPMQAWTRKWSDGHGRIWVPLGLGHQARELIKQWFKDNGLESTNMRVEENVSYRDVTLIPQHLVDGLTLETTDWLWKRIPAVRKKMVTDMDLIEDEDTKSIVYFFVRDLLDRYNDSFEGASGGKPLNYRAYVKSKVGHWQQDMLRDERGRGVVDSQTKINRATDAFEAKYHRLPTRQELAKTLNMSVAELSKKERNLASFTSVQNRNSLVSDFNDNEGEMFGSTIVADEAEDTEGMAIKRSTDAALARAILGAVRRDSLTATKGKTKTVDPLALVVLYKMTWEDLGKADVAKQLGVVPKTVSLAQNRVSKKIRENADLF